MLRNTLNTFITATFIMLLGVSSSAQAIVPANSKITSSSSLTVEGLEPLTATVSVTVNLQRSQPVIALKAGTEIQPNPSPNRWISGTTKSLTYTYTITTTANGLATYSVNAKVAQEGLSEAPSTEVDGDTISLGATAAISNQGLVVTVPYDGAADNKINGISQNDTVVIDGRPYNVDSLTDSAEVSILKLNEDPGELLLGTLIAEQVEFTVTLSDIVLADNAPQGQTNPKLTVTATQPGVAVAQAPDQSFLVIELRAADMQMYVRNLSEEPGRNPASDADNSETYPQDSDNHYFETDLVNTNPGDTLEYLVMIRAGNDGPLTAEPYQRPNTTYGLVYVAGTTALNTASLADDAITAGVTLKHEGADEDTIATDQTAYVTYQVTVIGGDGGDVDLPLTPDEIELACNGVSPQLFSIETCKGQPWDARNGTTLEKNPVCWDSTLSDGWQVRAVNPWVVGTATAYNQEAYDCRTKCADKSGESFDHCSTVRWWENEDAKATVCTSAGNAIKLTQAGSWPGGVRGGPNSYWRCVN